MDPKKLKLIIILSSALLAVIILSVVLICIFFPGKQAPQENSMWVYSGYSVHGATKQEAAKAEERVKEFEVLLLPEGHTSTSIAKDYFTFKNGVIMYSHHVGLDDNGDVFDGELAYINYVLLVDEAGKYEGKEITFTDSKYTDAYIKNDVLYVTWNPDGTEIVLEFNLKD